MVNDFNRVKVFNIVTAWLWCMKGAFEMLEGNAQKIEVLGCPEYWVRCKPRVLYAQSVKGLIRRGRHCGWCITGGG